MTKYLIALCGLLALSTATQAQDVKELLVKINGITNQGEGLKAYDTLASSIKEKKIDVTKWKFYEWTDKMDDSYQSTLSVFSKGEKAYISIAWVEDKVAVKVTSIGNKGSLEKVVVRVDKKAAKTFEWELIGNMAYWGVIFLQWRESSDSSLRDSIYGSCPDCDLF